MTECKAVRTGARVAMCVRAQCGLCAHVCACGMVCACVCMQCDAYVHVQYMCVHGVCVRVCCAHVNMVWCVRTHVWCVAQVCAWCICACVYTQVCVAHMCMWYGMCTHVCVVCAYVCMQDMENGERGREKTVGSGHFSPCRSE